MLFPCRHAGRRGLAQALLCAALLGAGSQARKNHKLVSNATCLALAATSKPEIWECDNGECIELKYKCDGVQTKSGANDCSDDSDENLKYCGCGNKVDPIFCKGKPAIDCVVANPAIANSPPLKLAAQYVFANCPVLCNNCLATATTTGTTTVTTSVTSTLTSTGTSTLTSTLSMTITTSTTTTTTTVTPQFVDLRKDQFDPTITGVLVALAVIACLLIGLVVHHHNEKNAKREAEMKQANRLADLAEGSSRPGSANRVGPAPEGDPNMIHGKPVDMSGGGAPFRAPTLATLRTGGSDPFNKNASFAGVAVQVEEPHHEEPGDVSSSTARQSMVLSLPPSTPDPTLRSSLSS